MAEEFEGGVCGGNWPWNSSRNFFGGSSPCSLASNDIRSFGNWSNHDPLMEMKATRSSTDDSAGSASDASSSIQLLQDVRKPNGMDSNIQIMGISLSASSTSTNDANWNHDFLHESGRSEENYSNILQGENINYSINNSFKQVDQSYPDHQLEQQQVNSTELSCASAASTGFPLNSASYGYTSSLLQTLFDTDSDQTQQSNLLDNQPAAMNNYSSSSPANYNNHNQVDSNEFLPGNRLPFTNNAPLWNASAAALSNVRASFLPSAQTQFVPSSVNNNKPNFPSSRAKHQNESAKKASNEPAFKRPRMETPSPLPTFKVRKEKLGDRVTALQQLVSPFGKTDTASVLHEAIEYIKFLHDQVSALSTPYLKNGYPPVQRQQIADKFKDEEGLIQDLKSRGLCLVPISSTFPVAAETTTDFWIPTFGASFK